MKRLTPVIMSDHGYTTAAEMVEDPSGSFISWEDHITALEVVRDEVRAEMKAWMDTGLAAALEANQQVIETLRAALELSREWIGILRGSCGDVSMQMGDDRDPSVLEEAVYSTIAAALAPALPKPGAPNVAD